MLTQPSANAKPALCAAVFSNASMKPNPIEIGDVATALAPLTLISLLLMSAPKP